MKNVIITGANSGLGFETAKKIAKESAYRVILACRNDVKASQARADISASTGNENIVAMKLDTSSLSSVRAFADKYINEYGTVDVLINNAGISSMRDSGTTEEGFKKNGDGITVNSFNPGFMATTNFSGGHADKARALVVKTTMPDRYGELEKSSEALFRTATDEQFSNISGKYFDRSTNIKESSALSYVKENRDELWEKSLRYLQICLLEKTARQSQLYLLTPGDPSPVHIWYTYRFNSYGYSSISS